MKNDTDTGNMQKEVMSVTEQVERKKNDIEKDDTGKKRKPDISLLEGLLFNKIANSRGEILTYYIIALEEGKFWPMNQSFVSYETKQCLVSLKKNSGPCLKFF